MDQSETQSTYFTGALVYYPAEHLDPDCTNPYVGRWELAKSVEQVTDKDPDRLLFPPYDCNELATLVCLGNMLREKYDCGSPNFSRLSKCRKQNEPVPGGEIYVYKYPHMLNLSAKYFEPGDLSIADIKQLVDVIKKYDAVLGCECHDDPDILAAGVCNAEGKKGLMIYDPEKAAALLEEYNRKKEKQEREKRRREERRKNRRPPFTVSYIAIFVRSLQRQIDKFLPGFFVYSSDSWRRAMSSLQCAVYLSESMFGPHAYRSIKYYTEMIDAWKKSQGKRYGKIPAWLIHWLDSEAAVKKPPKTNSYDTYLTLRCKRLQKLQRIPEPSEDTPSEPEQQSEQPCE